MANFGAALAPLPDIDGNGIDDVAVGAPGSNQVFILFLGPSGTILSNHSLDTTQLPLFSSDRFGSAIASLGDFNDDGNVDIIVGNPMDDTGCTFINCGSAFIIFLDSTGQFQSEVTILGNTVVGSTLSESNFGASIANIGDLDIDGVTDVVVGAPGHNGEDGAIFVLFLTDMGTVSSFVELSEVTEGIPIDTNAEFGFSVANVGDVNGDMIQDIAIGAPFTNGAINGEIDVGGVYILFMNRDGSFDFPASQFFTLDENLLNLTLNANDHLGMSISNAGDVNSDGVPDLIVGATGHDDGCGGQPCNRGAVYYFLLSIDGSIQEIVQVSTNFGGLQGPLETNNNFGSAVASIADLNGDSVPDSLFGASLDNDGAVDAGAIYLGFVQFCGDGFISAGETCEDTNLDNGDGCSDQCQTELGFQCNAQGCSPICGDGLVRGEEQCDDGNTEDGDGCSGNCGVVGEVTSTNASLSDGAIIGVVFGVLIAFLCVIALFIFLFIAYGRRQKQAAQELELESLKSNNIPILKDVKVGELLGKGQFGEVFKGTWAEQSVALKSLIGESAQDLSNEFTLLNDLRHPNIITFLGVYQDNQGVLYMTTEFMNRGDLLALLQTEGDISKQDLLDIVMQISHGMTYLHNKNVIHRDLSCRNILISGESPSFNAKVADFGLSRLIQNYYKSNAKVIPIRWTAPEALTFMKFTTKSDVWSFSILLWEVYARGAVPYPGYSNQEVSQKVESGYRMKPPRGTPFDVTQMMARCWDHDPAKRPEFSEISSFLRQAKENVNSLEEHRDSGFLSSKPVSYSIPNPKKPVTNPYTLDSSTSSISYSKTQLRELYENSLQHIQHLTVENEQLKERLRQFEAK